MNPGTTLTQAKQWLLARVDDGAHCPCCTQLAKVYRRKINATMARALMTMFTHGRQEFVHAPSLPGDTHEVSQLAWWGLVQEERVAREDGGRAGWWRVTPLGADFATNRVHIPKYARVYDGRCLGLDDTETVSILDALGDRFDYRELMSA